MHEDDLKPMKSNHSSKICVYTWAATSFNTWVRQHAPTWVCLTLYTHHRSRQGSFRQPLAIEWKISAPCWTGPEQHSHAYRFPADRLSVYGGSTHTKLCTHTIKHHCNAVEQMSHRTNDKEPQIYKLQNYYATQIQRYVTLLYVWHNLHTVMVGYLDFIPVQRWGTLIKMS